MILVINNCKINVDPAFDYCISLGIDDPAVQSAAKKCSTEIIQ